MAFVAVAYTIEQFFSVFDFDCLFFWCGVSRETNLTDSNTVPRMNPISLHSHSLFSCLSSLQSDAFRFDTGAGGDDNIPQWQKKLKKGAHKMTTGRRKKTHKKPSK